MDIKDISEVINNPFSNIEESGLDSDNHIIKRVCLFGTRESQNNRTYKDKAIDSLTNLAEGSKCFIDHPSKTSIKETDGVRSIRDFAGVFRNAVRQDEKIFADLHAREAYWDLFSDIAVLEPSGCGLSINARVKVYSDKEGVESVEDAVALRSTDLVSSAATTKNLFESHMEKVIEEKSRLIIVPGSIEKIVELMLVNEGIIQDKLDNDKVKWEIDNITWTANSMIDKILYDEKLGLKDKKKKVLAIFGDLEGEVKKRLASISETLKQIQGDETEMKDITLEQLKLERKDLIEAIVNDYKESEEAKNLKTELENSNEALEGKDIEIERLNTEKGELQKEKAELEKEVGKLKGKVDLVDVERKASEKREKVDELIKEAKLDKEALSDVFIAGCMAVEEYEKDGEPVTLEDQVKVIIEDRRKVWDKGAGKVTGSGEDNTDELEDKDKEVTEETVDKFAKEQKSKPGSATGGWQAH